jgi:hypothetical protein
VGFGCGNDDHAPTNPHRLEACATKCERLDGLRFVDPVGRKEEELEKINVFHGIVAAVARPQF